MTSEFRELLKQSNSDSSASHHHDDHHHGNNSQHHDHDHEHHDDEHHEADSNHWRATPLLIVLILTAAFAGFLFGYDTSAVGGAIYFIGIEREKAGLAPLSSFMLGLIPASTPLGAVIGSLPAGIVSDRFGRKPAIILSGVIFTLGAVIMAVSDGEAILVVGRFIVGIGVGLVSMIVPVYLAEMTPEKIRGAVIATNILFVTGGQFIAYCCNLLLADVPNQWRWLLGLSAVPAVLQLIGMLFLPESPRWLIAHDRSTEAQRVLTKIRGDESIAKRDAMRIADALRDERPGSFRELFDDVTNRRALILACGVLVIQQLCAINTVMYYVPYILSLSGATNIAAWSLLPAGTNAVGTIVSILLVDRIGRRLLLLSSIVAVILSLLVFSAVVTFAKSLTVWALVLYLIAFSPGLGPVPWAISSEIFALRVRGNGTSISTASNWLSNFVISMTFPIFTNAIGISNAMLLYCVFGVVSFLFVYFLLIETRGLTLEEIQTLLRNSPRPKTIFNRSK